MYFILISSLLIVLFFFILLVSLNYILYTWENGKLMMLAKPNKGVDSENRNLQSKNRLLNVASQTQNLINITTSKSVKVFGKLYNQASIQMPKNNSHSSFSHSKKYSEYFQSLVGNTKKFILYVVSLTRPATIDSDRFIESHDEDTNSFENEEFSKKDNLHNLQQVPGADNISQGKTNSTETYQDVKEVATIGLISNNIGNGDTNKDKETLSTFDNLENRILAKLKESGMSNYDIWLELGDLYLKYNENKKAMEVYALVLKHSKNEKHKELARNGLIGI
jgi:hypothetical protein